MPWTMTTMTIMVEVVTMEEGTTLAVMISGIFRTLPTPGFFSVGLRHLGVLAMGDDVELRVDLVFLFLCLSFSTILPR